MAALLPFRTVNAFAPTPHAGNQAAVVIFPTDDPRASDDEYYRALSADFNLAETAFLVPKDTESKTPRYGLRWFTPEVEVPLCGHATLAAAAALFDLHPNAVEVEFETRWSGSLTARVLERGKAKRVSISLPIPAELRPANPSEEAGARAALKASSGVEDVVRVAHFNFGVIVEVPSSVDIEALKVDVAQFLPTYPELFIITQVSGASTNGAVINSRVFAPGVGIAEDPVTGAAHAALTQFYLGNGEGRASVQAVKEGATELDARQLSKRGGAMTCELVDGRAQLTGLGWLTAKGELEVLP
ncbi:hypothetical protein CspeluHIS016_0201960 [Cutaneotrichosporon spelunceum]|uniref:Diaminopimelate epimerase-like protein n=1 Tax=Cutaneotrichosporon spelunceum TaxID=1672016 RepID=A0AAD3TQU8_9TREE|nr:hypothetical protein CspeluHIS016_0201960 [Cutaneotrichosporon spelunceum]